MEITRRTKAEMGIYYAQQMEIKRNRIEALEAKNKELLEMIVWAKDRINMDTPIKDELWWYEKLGKLLADKGES